MVAAEVQASAMVFLVLAGRAAVRLEIVSKVTLMVLVSRLAFTIAFLSNV